VKYPSLITPVVLALCGTAWADNSVKVALTESPDAGFFDLFGRRVERASQNMDGSMPEGVLEVSVVPPKRPPLLAARKSAAAAKVASGKASGSAVRKPKVAPAPAPPKIPANARAIAWSPRYYTDVNSGGTPATHVVKSGDRVMLRSFGQ